MSGSTLKTRTKQTAIETARQTDPVWLQRLITVDKALAETMETMYAQAARRDEAVYELAAAGVTYRDLSRILGCSHQRVRFIVARHLGITPEELNPRTNNTTIISNH